MPSIVQLEQKESLLLDIPSLLLSPIQVELILPVSDADADLTLLVHGSLRDVFSMPDL